MNNKTVYLLSGEYLTELSVYVSEQNGSVVLDIKDTYPLGFRRYNYVITDEVDYLIELLMPYSDKYKKLGANANVVTDENSNLTYSLSKPFNTLVARSSKNPVTGEVVQLQLEDKTIDTWLSFWLTKSEVLELINFLIESYGIMK